ncbi:MAG: dTDP-4-dehydrorhamnose reductase [Candidatus Bathyarchaeia archaeon]|jgi:dTDP-4-dehydrorhamnose reductase|nr:dTDP-4-dehydrorhamnose reductase [Candidatus Bathyarchaeota archaeon A05DMB-4]MDH7595127.1 dTDP-4-dehydrorhamnose reductase [Candidatus Bathyarchaeota archaeon]
MEKIIITGASGLLGSKLVETTKRFYEVTPTHSGAPLFTNSIRMDVTDFNQVSEVFNRIQPEFVVHTAAMTNVDRCETDKKNAWKINVQGTENVAKMCAKYAAKLVYVSTDYVFDGEKGLYSEDDATAPINYYGLTKLEGENKVKQYCKDYVIARTSVLYGWHERKPNFATWVINSLRNNMPITVVDDHFNSPTLADNLAEIILETLQKNLTGTYHTAGDERISRYDFAKTIANTFLLNEELITPTKMSQLKAWVAKRPRDSSLSVNKAKETLKTRLMNIKESLTRLKEQDSVNFR